MKNQNLFPNLILSVLIFLSSSVFAVQKEKPSHNFEKIFNGKNLNGWSVKCLPSDRGLEFWKVVDGVIECNSLNNANHDYIWLQYDKELKDFELKLKFQAFRESPGNSGVQIRSRYSKNNLAKGGYWLDGPQVDIDPGTQWRTGLIYDETWEERRWICPSLSDSHIDKSFAPEKVDFVFADEKEGWNDLRIICKGTRIQTFLNGNLVADYDGEGVLNNKAHKVKKISKKGFVALQLHMKDRLKINYKDILVREL